MDLPTTHAIFLSQTSQDAETAKRICESVRKDGKPVLALSTSGGDSQDQQVLNVLLNIIIFNQELQIAIEAPRINTNHPHSSFENHPDAPGQLDIESRIAVAVQDALRARGHVLRALTPP
jgi:gamma-glutamyltranspeptidase/glutathione hydrolase